MAVPLIGLALGALRAVGGRAIASMGAAALRQTGGRIGSGVLRTGRSLTRNGEAQWYGARAARRARSVPLTTQQTITTNNYSSTTLQNANNSNTTNSVAATVNGGTPRPTSGIPPIGGDNTSRPSQGFDPEITRLNSRDVISRFGQFMASFIPAIGGYISRIRQFTNKHYDFVKAQELGRYSGLTAVGDAQIKVGNIQRKIGRAQYTSESEYSMTISRNRLEQAKEPFRAVYQKTMNQLTSVAYDIEAAAYEGATNLLGDYGGIIGQGAGLMTGGGYFSGQLGKMMGDYIAKEIKEAQKHQTQLDLLQQSFLGNMAHPKKDDRAQQAAKKFSRNVGTPQGPARTSGGY